MAKKVTGIIKLQLPAGAANPAPPVGPALGAAGVNIMAFCKDFNARTKDKAGTYTCVIKYRGGVKRVYWNPNKRVKIRTAKSATFAVNIYGKQTKVRGGSTKKVNYQPIMVRSKF